jgi:organic hydroperoxide reductase OsmC/OhrA
MHRSHADYRERLMTDTKQRLTFDVAARRLDAHGSIATCKSATIRLDTDLAGTADAFNPAELLLAALAACVIKGLERVQPMLHFQLRGALLHEKREEVRHGIEAA